MRAAIPFVIAALVSGAAFVLGALAYEGGVPPSAIIAGLVIYGGGWTCVALEVAKRRPS